jgi:hypothetical protein
VIPEVCLVRSRLALALVLGSLLSWAGCISRTTPLPPPEVSAVSLPDADGRVTVTGLALEGAAIGVINNRTLEGVITSSPMPDCHSACPFEAHLAAESGDSLRVWQFFETDGLQDVPVPSP